MFEGWKALPKPGDLVLEVETERRAKDVVDLRLTKEKTGKLVEDDTAIEERFRKTFFLFKRSHCTKKNKYDSVLFLFSN